MCCLHKRARGHLYFLQYQCGKCTSNFIVPGSEPISMYYQNNNVPSPFGPLLDKYQADMCPSSRE